MKEKRKTLSIGKKIEKKLYGAYLKTNVSVQTNECCHKTLCFNNIRCIITAACQDQFSFCALIFLGKRITYITSRWKVWHWLHLGGRDFFTTEKQNVKVHVETGYAKNAIVVYFCHFIELFLIKGNTSECTYTNSFFFTFPVSP